MKSDQSSSTMDAPIPNKFLMERWDDQQASVTIGIGKEATLEEALEAFEVFLIACGYLLPHNNHIDIVED